MSVPSLDREYQQRVDGVIDHLCKVVDNARRRDSPLTPHQASF
jgi:hypothetical protein